MTVVLYPGSFDPIHNGHVEIVETAARLFDRVVVAAMRNPQKGEPLFTLEERQELIEDSLTSTTSRSRCSRHWWSTREGGRRPLIIKGLRAVSDFESELQMAQMNRSISGVDTCSSRPLEELLPGLETDPEVARFGGDVTTMVPAPVANRLKVKYPTNRQDLNTTLRTCDGHHCHGEPMSPRADELDQRSGGRQPRERRRDASMRSTGRPRRRRSSGG